MRVKWIEFNEAGYKAASDMYPSSVNPKDFETTFEGDVIDKYHTFWGTPKFVVALPDGRITSVNMTECRVIKDGKENT